MATHLPFNVSLNRNTSKLKLYCIESREIGLLKKEKQQIKSIHIIVFSQIAHFKGFKVVSIVLGKKKKEKKKAHLTQLPCKLWRTLTHEAVQHCVTLAAVLAGFAGALVPLDLAVRANEAGGTQAAEASWTLLRTTHTESAGDYGRSHRLTEGS